MRPFSALLALCQRLLPRPALHTWHGPRLRPDGTATWVWHSAEARTTITRRDDGPYCVQAHPRGGAPTTLGAFGTLCEAQAAVHRPHA